MMSHDWRGDFLGFEFNEVHSSDYNIVIISGGDRFLMNLLPPSQDVTANIPGGDGSYYFESFYQPLVFTLRIGYDNLQEQDIRSLRAWLSTREIHNLVFDENPYKVYSCKITGQPKLDFIAFDNDDKTKRFYRGEGEIQFTAYNPLAKVRYKTLEEYSLDRFPEKHLWAATSGLLQTRLGTITYDRVNGGIARLYNPGDLATPLIVPEFSVQTASGYLSITYSISGDQKGRMIIDLSKLKVGDHYRFDSERQLILGYDYSGGVYKLNNKVYNSCIAAGDFIKVEPHSSELVTQQIVFSPSTAINFIRTDDFDLNYDYLYF